MGNLMRIAELEGQVERKDAYIDKLELRIVELSTDRDQRAELSARLFSENELLKKQLNDKQAELDICQADRDDMRQRIYELQQQRATVVAQALEIEADLIMTAPADGYFAGNRWTEADAKLVERIGSMLKARAALVRAKAGA